MNTTNEMFKSNTKVESLLAAMPKRCSCAVCRTTKGMAKNSLGEKKFKEICTTIGLVA